MAGSVIEVKTSLPECLSCKVIKVDTDAAVEEFCISKTKGSHRSDGEMFFFFLGQRSNYDCSGNIGRSLIILSAGVHQVHAFWLQNREIVFRCLIMAHSSIRAVSGNRSEAWLNKAFLLLPEGFQFFSNGNLIHWDFTDILL